MEDIKDENKVDDIIDYIKLDYGNLINKNTLGNLFSCNVDKQIYNDRVKRIYLHNDRSFNWNLIDRKNVLCISDVILYKEKMYLVQRIIVGVG